MPTFFFHVHKNGEIIQDSEGIDLPGANAALEEATQAARDLMAEKVKRGDIVDGDEFAVHDDLGKLLFVLPFKSVLRVE